MLRAGAGALGGRLRLWLPLYGVQLFFGLLFTFAAARAFAGAFADRPLFDRAVGGDLVAVYASFRDHAAILSTLLWSGVAIAVGYGVLSWVLAAGLVGALAGRPFAEAAAARWFAFARLWAWALVPNAVAIVMLAIGGALGLARDPTTPGQLAGRLLLGFTPGLIVLAITGCAVDYARIALVRDPALGAGRALLAGARRTFRGPAPLLHYLGYWAIWCGVTAVYILLTLGRPWAGAGGAVGLFALRQVVLATRFAARVATYAGQVSLPDGQ
jgi:hypothetical protein